MSLQNLRRLRFCVAIAALLVCIGMVGGAGRSYADSRTDFLVKMLSTSDQFRVRAQAALALAGIQEPTITTALIRALRKDEHPAVRAASASALERSAGVAVVAALKDAQRDPDPAVRAAAKKAVQEIDRIASAKSSQPTDSHQPSGGSVFYVGIGLPGSQVPSLSPAVLRGLREHLSREVVQIAGVRLAPENEPRGAAERELRSQKLVGYFIDSSVTSLETKPDGSIRAQVSVIVGTYPGRDMRAMLSGAATISGGSGEETRLEAVQAAYTGALRRLPQAMQAGIARAP